LDPIELRQSSETPDLRRLRTIPSATSLNFTGVRKRCEQEPALARQYQTEVAMSYLHPPPDACAEPWVRRRTSPRAGDGVPPAITRDVRIRVSIPMKPAAAREDCHRIDCGGPQAVGIGFRRFRAARRPALSTRRSRAEGRRSEGKPRPRYWAPCRPRWRAATAAEIERHPDGS
jgi:hypothetical protein